MAAVIAVSATIGGLVVYRNLVISLLSVTSFSILMVQQEKPRASFENEETPLVTREGLIAKMYAVH